jgi:hypothetical protein
VTPAQFNGKTYPMVEIAERQREVAVSLKALHLMQEHHGNKYLSFQCVNSAEEAEWYAKAELLVEPVTVDMGAMR